MSLIPEFELGLWNAWIFVLSFLLLVIVWQNFHRIHKGQKGSSRPNKPPFNGNEKKLFGISQLIFWTSVIYSFFSPLKLDTTWFYVGLLVYLCGIIFHFVAATDLVNTPLDRPATKRLFRISRNPLYFSTFLIFAGIGIACASWLILLLIAIFTVLQNILIDAEERWCLEKYGDAYREYMNRTPRWIGISKSGKE